MINKVVLLGNLGRDPEAHSTKDGGVVTTLSLATPVRKGEIPYRVPVRVQAKILFWNHLIENGYRVSDVAKKLSISQTQAQRYVDLTKDRASMDAVEETMEAFGIALTVYVDD